MFLTVKKASIIGAVSLLIAFAVLTASVGVTNSASVYFCKTTRKLPVYGVDTDKKVIALTFDAAWGADKTQGILDVMGEYNARVRFSSSDFGLISTKRKPKPLPMRDLKSEITPEIISTCPNSTKTR